MAGDGLATSSAMWPECSVLRAELWAGLGCRPANTCDLDRIVTNACFPQSPGGCGVPGVVQSTDESAARGSSTDGG
jgi:hypothetical protein